MRANTLLRSLFIVSLLLFNIGCDQISKNIVRQSIHLNQQYKFLNNHIMLTRVENSGAFLSFGDTFPPAIRFCVLILIPFIALIAGLFVLFRRSNLSKSTMLAICFIVGGGFGNIYDRYLYGSVTDFVHVDLIIFRTGIFNMADVSIVTGALIVIVSYFLKRTKAVMDLDEGQL